MVQEDRKRLSLFMNLDIMANIGMAQLPWIRRGPAVDRAKLRELARHFFGALSIKARSADQVVRDLSGGNQQKVVLARWLATNPKFLILDEPTHGIDIGAKSEIYDLIRRLAGEGMSIILIASELPEIIAMADRAVVMHEGRVAATLERGDITEHTIMSYATGNIGGNPR